MNDDYNFRFTKTLMPGKPLEDYTPEEQDKMLRDELQWSVDRALVPTKPYEPAYAFAADLIKNWKSYPIGAIITLYPDGRVTFETYKTKEDPRASIHTSNPSTGI